MLILTRRTVARSLHGNWREEHLFALAHYEILQPISILAAPLPALQKGIPLKLSDTFLTNA